MKVRELIEKLKEFDFDTRVVTPGFDESGYDDVAVVKSIKIEFHDEREMSFGGRHKKSEKGKPAVYINFV